MCNSKSENPNRLDEIIAEYLAACEAGNPPGESELLAIHPEYADQLSQFFTDKQQLDQLANEGASVPDAERLVSDKDKTPVDSIAPTIPPTPAPIPTGSTPSPSLVGESIHYFGDYELLEEIARGGMGVVYKARQVSLNRIVALKMILAGELASEDAVKRFHTEAEAAAHLKHPNIVGIYEVGETRGQHYFSMEFIEGCSLAQLIKQSGDSPMSPDKAARYVKTIAEAIQYAHLRGVLHRDLKPANIMIDESDLPKITDFGLAKRADSQAGLTQTGQVLGTPAYMPPEQVSGGKQEIGPPSDVYSLGAVFYELLTGQPPFQSDTPIDTMMQVLDQSPIAPRKRIGLIPVDLETICLKCLEKRPEHRYSSARELVQDLQRYLAGQPILARPVSVVRKATGWIKRRPWLVTTVVTYFVLGLLAVTYYQWAQIQFLHWTINHPNSEWSGWRIDLNSELTGWTLIVWFGLVFANSTIEKNFRRRKTTGRALSPRISMALGIPGVIGIVLAIFLLKTAIDVFVWDRQNQYSLWTAGPSLLVVYLGCTSAVGLICRVAREIELFNYGTTRIIPEKLESPLDNLIVWLPGFCLKLLLIPWLIRGMPTGDIIPFLFGKSFSKARYEAAVDNLPPVGELDKQQRQEIRQLLFADKRVQAIVVYKEAVPNASLWSAKTVVEEFQEELWRSNPERIPQHPGWVGGKGCLPSSLSTIFFIVGLVFLYGAGTGDPALIITANGFVGTFFATTIYRWRVRRLPIRFRVLVAAWIFVSIASVVCLIGFADWFTVGWGPDPSAPGPSWGRGPKPMLIGGIIGVMLGALRGLTLPEVEIFDRKQKHNSPSSGKSQ